MKVVCQNCRAEVIVSSLGRKAFTIPGIKVCNALRLCSEVLEANSL